MTPFERAVEVMARAMYEWQFDTPWETSRVVTQLYRKRATAALRALIAAEGKIVWKLVPVVATEGMCEATYRLETLPDIYTAMLTAAPGLEDGE
jgi:hypothetical protein